MPLFRKAHSRGEFVFDFSWAGAYAQQGLEYYPKLLTAVPFTPVSGPRLLISADRRFEKTDQGGAARRDGLRARRNSCPRGTCCSQPTKLQPSLDQAGLILRRDCQFHWYNQGYESFEAFLATFTAEKRKKVKRERRRVAEAGIEFDTLHGGEMDASLWKIVYAFYADTFHRHGHEPYLNLDFFKRIGAAMPNQLMLKVARDRPRADRRGHLLRGRRGTLRPLLGRRRQLSQPAFRGLLLPGNRVLHRARSCSASSRARKASTRFPGDSFRR